MPARIHHIQDTFVNIYLIIEPNGVSLVDTGTTQSPKRIARALAQHGLALSDVRHILITHADPDHTGGLAAIQTASNAITYAGEQEAAAIARGKSSRPPRATPLTAPLFGMMNLLMPMPPARADRIVQAGDELPILGGLKVLETPGHTPTHRSYYAPTYNILFAGDSIMAMGGAPRFMDGPFTWDYQQGRDSMQMQLDLHAKMVCCGHGPVLQG